MRRGRALDEEYEEMTAGAMWWGENVLGQLTEPIELPIANRLVLSPHVYGHDLNKEYMTYETFPANMPAVWDRHFGVVGEQRGVPIVIGEWGGVWEDSELSTVSKPTLSCRKRCINRPH